MGPYLTQLLIVADGLRSRATRVIRDARAGRTDVGMSTLEVAIIALGLMAVAAILVGAITSAVQSRVSKIQ